MAVIKPGKPAPTVSAYPVTAKPASSGRPPLDADAINRVPTFITLNVKP